MSKKRSHQPSSTLSIVTPPCRRDAHDGFITASNFEHLAYLEWGSSRCLTPVIHMAGRISTVVQDAASASAHKTWQRSRNAMTATLLARPDRLTDAA